MMIARRHMRRYESRLVPGFRHFDQKAGDTNEIRSTLIGSCTRNACASASTNVRQKAPRLLLPSCAHETRARSQMGAFHDAWGGRVGEE